MRRPNDAAAAPAQPRLSPAEGERYGAVLASFAWGLEQAALPPFGQLAAAGALLLLTAERLEVPAARVLDLVSGMDQDAQERREVALLLHRAGLPSASLALMQRPQLPACSFPVPMAGLGTGGRR